MYSIQLSADQIRNLMASDRNGGGFQSLLGTLQDGLQPNGELMFSGNTLSRARRYATQYGNGGWENQLHYLLGNLI